MTTLRKPDFLEGKDPKDVFIDRWRPDLSGVTDGFIKSILERIFVLEPKERLTARELHKTLATFDTSVGELGGQCAMLKYRCGSLEAARIMLTLGLLLSRRPSMPGLVRLPLSRALSRARVKSIWPREG